ncbi:hypothetical protein CI105_02790 [Candidatus Izimaplasma bacterium ZiA1]|uniref:MATE family efflux transporter n=1 Tax=Candidatus Izimoplasma sp. ZiA1 TaxID=2024899 RepID=UPI000BAA6F3E|nr:hypothetical protein CI105_02790 [Candidatus Izimaplasma bacterium ZiA1]
MTQDEGRRHLILYDKNIYKGLLLLSLPLMLNNLIKTLHDIVDMYFVGQIDGFAEQSINAIQLTFPVMFTFISLGIGLSVAGTALISQYVGASKFETARKYATQLLVFSFLLGLILNVLAFLSADSIMTLMGIKDYEFIESVKYIRIRSFELPVVFMFFAFSAIRQSTGDTITPLVFGLITIFLNIILSWLFIEYFSLGVSGAAYATLVANVSILPLGVRYLLFAKNGVRISLRYLKPDLLVFRNITIIAVPAAFGQAITAIGFGVMNSIIYGFGTMTVAAFGIGNRLSSMILHPVMAIGGVISSYIGQNIGNENIPRAKETFRKGMRLSVFLMMIGALSVLPFREDFAKIFLEDEQAISLATEYMFYLLIGLPLMAIFQTFIGTFNGTGNTRFTFIISVTRLWLLRVPTILIFREYTNLGSSGVWYAMLISNFVIAFVGFTLYSRVDFKPKIKERKVRKLVLET